MKISNLTNLAGVEILSRDAQRQIFGGGPGQDPIGEPSSCSAKCWGGGTVSCNGKGQCSATDATNGTPSGAGKCCIEGDCLTC